MRDPKPHGAQDYKSEIILMILVFLVVVLWVISVVMPARDYYDDTVQLYSDIRMEVIWIENNPEDVSKADLEKLDKDVAMYNQRLQLGRERCYNSWNGRFYNDALFTMEKIDISDWLQQQSSD